ncbi:MAG: hypothetical protein ACK4SY_00560 [Pyrobaculum sp.]
MFKPGVDPCIFIHYIPEDWETLLGGDFVKELLRRLRHVARDVDDLVEFARESPPVIYMGLRGLKIGGVYRRDWMLYIEGGYVSPSYRTRWPPVVEYGTLDIRLQVSPCYLLTSLHDGRAYVWRNRAPTLFKWVSDVPKARPLWVFRSAFPQWLRELARERGYAWVAWSRWRDRRNRHLAEWLYWLDTGRMPYVDAKLGRWGDVCRNANCTKTGGGGILYKSP